ncbi:MAG: PAS domain S-box protein [Chloroflexi bacterium]|nr:PAS domain S-box protein [Chloroflexota bacterium]
MFDLTPISLALFITTAINSVVAYLSWLRRKTKGGKYFALGMTGLTFWTLAAGLDYAAVPLPLKIFFATLEAWGYLCAHPLFTLFALSFAGFDSWIEKKWVKALFVFIPASNILLITTNGFHGWIWKGFIQSSNNVVIFEHGPGFIWVVITSHLMTLTIITSLWTASRRGSEISRRQGRLLLLAILLPLAANLIYLFGVGGVQGVDWTSITFSATGFLFLRALSSQHLLDLIPIARDKLVQSLGDGMIVLDLQNRIIDINQIAQNMLGSQPRELVGKSITEIMPFAQSLSEQTPELEIKTEWETGSEFKKYFDVLVSPLREGKNLIGRLIIFRDITERKQMDGALQNRTNVLEALHQVTLDLVNRHEMDDILQVLLGKIGTLLDAPDISIDLIETEDNLVTHAVTPGQPLKKGDVMRRGEGGWLSWQAIDGQKPVFLEDYSTWQKRRPLYEEYPIHAIMVVPILQLNTAIGTINISRTVKNKPFNNSDVYVAGQLAQMVALVLDNAKLYSMLHSKLAESVKREEALYGAQVQLIEQQRTLAMVDERQRMARDLHDSVNQSIHSLVLFSETLVSMLDKNKVDRAREISGRLQESARQALKETRLLLYETQTSVNGRSVNFIEELNARLASVELRAGIRAEIIQEGSLKFCPEDWQENLLWITIEALNNALKHAQAHSVQIMIRSFSKYLEVEVVDDGSGFDITRPDAGGYGLRNMQERAGLLGGTLTFTSTPQNGTSVLFHAKHAEVKE